MSDSATLARFREIISIHTGLVIPEHDLTFLQEKLSRRLSETAALRGKNRRSEGAAHYYLALLEEETPESRAEWRELVLDLTTGESYFFRDEGQMRLLRETIFPELMSSRREERRLRVWSAGCSSGEEPYSLAIMLKKLLPFSPEWHLLIKGTDINELSLKQAKAGRYNRWAFRGVPEDILAEFFFRHQGEWQLNASISSMVTFDKLNLIRDTFPSPVQDLYDMDLILCRNVFIYFDGDAIAGIMARFAASLRPGGYIITGHGEVRHPVSRLVTSEILPLVARHFPDSVVYQRPVQGMDLPWVRKKHQPEGGGLVARKARASVSPPQDRQPKTARTLGATRKRIPAKAEDSFPKVADKKLAEARLLFDQGSYAKAIQLTETLLLIDRLAFEASLLLAQIYANLGEAAKAEKHGRDALRHRPFAAEPHFLLANIVQERGDREQAEALLKKTIYLDRAHVGAYLQLASIYQEEGAWERTRQMRLAALDVLHSLPGSARVEHYEDWTVKVLVTQLEKVLGDTQQQKD